MEAIVEIGCSGLEVREHTAKGKPINSNCFVGGV